MSFRSKIHDVTGGIAYIAAASGALILGVGLVVGIVAALALIPATVIWWGWNFAAPGLAFVPVEYKDLDFWPVYGLTVVIWAIAGLFKKTSSKD